MRTSKGDANVRLLSNTSMGFVGVFNGEQILRGDESNQLAEIESYALVNLNGEHWLNDHVSVFGRAANVFDEEYETFGVVGEEPGEMLLNDFDDPHFFGS